MGRANFDASAQHGAGSRIVHTSLNRNRQGTPKTKSLSLSRRNMRFRQAQRWRWVARGATPPPLAVASLPAVAFAKAGCHHIRPRNQRAVGVEAGVTAGLWFLGIFSGMESEVARAWPTPQGLDQPAKRLRRRRYPGSQEQQITTLTGMNPICKALIFNPFRVDELQCCYPG